MLRTDEDRNAVGDRAMTIYENDIAPKLSDDDRGRYIAIDVNSGEWEIDDTYDAMDNLRERIPDAEIFLLTHIDIATGYFGSGPKELLDGLGILE